MPRVLPIPFIPPKLPPALRNCHLPQPLTHVPCGTFRLPGKPRVHSLTSSLEPMAVTSETPVRPVGHLNKLRGRALPPGGVPVGTVERPKEIPYWPARRKGFGAGVVVLGDGEAGAVSVFLRSTLLRAAAAVGLRLPGAGRPANINSWLFRATDARASLSMDSGSVSFDSAASTRLSMARTRERRSRAKSWAGSGSVAG